MEEKKEVIFPEGIYFKLPKENAPDFVKGQVSIKKADFITWIMKQTGEWINLDAKISKSDKGYFQVNTWKPDAPSEGTQSPLTKETNEEDIDPDSIPF